MEVRSIRKFWPLILFPESDSLLAKEIIRRGIELKCIYKQVNLIHRIVRKGLLKLPVPLKHFWYGEWRKVLDSHESIIIFDSIINGDLVKWIVKQKKSSRVIVWFWNPVRERLLNEIRDLPIELWSFDRRDCRIYDMRYNSQFYFHTIEIPETSIDYDLLFVGRDKNRLDFLCNLKKSLASMNVSTHLHVVSHKHSVKSNSSRGYLKYEEVLRLIAKSRSILDVVQPGQEGLTLRALEAVFLGKKLVTNNTHIMSEPIYDSSNVFVLGQRDIKELPEFLKTQTKKLPEKVLEMYDFDSWLKRFSV